MQGGDVVVVDPALSEEVTCEGLLTVTINPHGEVCAVQKAKGAGIAPSQVCGRVVPCSPRTMHTCV